MPAATGNVASTRSKKTPWLEHRASPVHTQPLRQPITRPTFKRDRMRIVIGNLPDDVTQDGIREALSAFAPLEAITLFHESGAPTALIELDTSRERAESLAKRIQGRIYNGRALRAWVPTMDWN